MANEKKPLHLAYAIPDHPWIDSADGAAVRIAMTVAAPGKSEGILEKVTAESPMEHGEVDVSLVKVEGLIAPNLQIGADLTSVLALNGNAEISSRGHELGSSGFIVTPEEAQSLLASSSPSANSIIRPYRNGRDLTERPRGVMLIDAHGLDESEIRDQHPAIYQHLLNRVKPDRATNRDLRLRTYWWLHRRSREDWRMMSKDLPRYIATVETSKHRFFTFLDQSILPDNMLVCIASDDAFHLSVLSSSIHVTWALTTGGRLGMGNDPRYNKSKCFEPFPFPALEEGPLKQRIRDLGERLDAHRKRQQEQHPGLTLTGMYNVLEKLRSGDPLTAKDKQIHDQGLVTLLKQLHDELDEAVLEAYGWQDCSGDHRSPNDHGKAEDDPRRPMIAATILTRLVALNHTRAAEEKTGQIRWLRPEYQNCGGDHRSPQQATLDVDPDTSKINNPKSTIINQTQAWPERLPAQVTLIRQLLAETPNATPEQLSAHFGRKNAKRTEQIEGIVETLRGLGQV